MSTDGGFDNWQSFKQAVSRTAANALKTNVPKKRHGDIRINLTRRMKPSPATIPVEYNVTPQDIATFCRQLAMLISSADSHFRVDMFEAVSENTDNQDMKELILDIRARICSGNSFSASLKAHPTQFDNFSCTIVHEGEQFGGAGLCTALENLASYQQDLKTRRNWK